MTVSAEHQQEARLAALLRQAGQRVTPQRQMILTALDRSGGHLSADEIYAAVVDRTSSVTRSTVYRTLERLRDVGVISETDLGHGVRHFELIEEERHHHLICRDCGVMVNLDDELIEPLRRSIRKRTGFEAGIDHLALFGRCEYCQGQAIGNGHAG